MMWPIFMKSNKRNKNQQSFDFTYRLVFSLLIGKIGGLERKKVQQSGEVGEHRGS